MVMTVHYEDPETAMAESQVTQVHNYYRKTNFNTAPKIRNYKIKNDKDFSAYEDLRSSKQDVDSHRNLSSQRSKLNIQTGELEQDDFDENEMA